MANNSTETGTPQTDHRATYDRFMTALKWGVVMIAIVLILMAIFLA